LISKVSKYKTGILTKPILLTFLQKSAPRLGSAFARNYKTN
jgi:hypothetical protein